MAYAERHGEIAPVLKTLEQRHVLTIERLSNGNFDVREDCDQYYSVELTPEDLVRLGQELIALGGR